jgi:hypothetical protein
VRSTVITQADLRERLRPVVRRYTGQESEEQRRQIATNPPDILLTNCMMFELLLTRQDEVDRTVIGNARGLKFIVLDELHTYRGRQGADVSSWCADCASVLLEPGRRSVLAPRPRWSAKAVMTSGRPACRTSRRACSVSRSGRRTSLTRACAGQPTTR